MGYGAGRGFGVEQAEFEQGATQNFGVSRFLDKGQGTEFLDPADGFILYVAGDHQHLASQTFGTDRRQGFVAVHHRHGQVQQHHLTKALTQRSKGFLAVGGLADGHRPFGRQGADQLLARHVGVVADH